MAYIKAIERKCNVNVKTIFIRASDSIRFDFIARKYRFTLQ